MCYTDVVKTHAFYLPGLSLTGRDMSLEIDVFKAIDVATDKIQNNSPVGKDVLDKIVVDTDIIYDESDPLTCVLDAYHIPRAEGRYPVMMYIHGGGFVAGDKRFRRGVSRWYACQGLYVFNVNYGLCPAYQYPAPLSQLVKAVNWIASRAEDLKLDTDKILISGDSAGAYYAAMLIAACNYKRVQKKLGVVPDIKFGAAVFNCGLYDIRSILEAKMLFNINNRIFRNFTGMTSEEFDDYFYKDLCAPTAYVNADYPPCFIVYSKKDIFCAGQAERFISALENKNIYFESYRSEALLANHCFPLNWKGKNATLANAMTVDFVNRFIGGNLPKRLPKAKKQDNTADGK